MRKLTYSPNGWLDYIYWQKSDKVVQQKIDNLTKEICKTPYSGLAKPVQLKFDMSTIWTRRIDLEHRIVYRVKEQEIQVIQCRYHY